LQDLYDDDDADLLPRDYEPEAWSVTVDIKTLKRMNSKDIKRQDHIWGQRLYIIYFTSLVSKIIAQCSYVFVFYFFVRLSFFAVLLLLPALW